MKLKSGFTVIELMITLAVIGILSTFLVQKYSSLIIKSKEASTKATLGTLRSAIHAYYGANEGFPTDPANQLVDEHYLDTIPSIEVPAFSSFAGHLKNASFSVADDDWATGAFLYSPSNENGFVFVNCSHLDTRGIPWSAN